MTTEPVRHANADEYNAELRRRLALVDEPLVLHNPLSEWLARRDAFFLHGELPPDGLNPPRIRVGVDLRATNYPVEDDGIVRVARGGTVVDGYEDSETGEPRWRCVDNNRGTPVYTVIALKEVDWSTYGGAVRKEIVRQRIDLLHRDMVKRPGMRPQHRAAIGSLTTLMENGDDL